MNHYSFSVDGKRVLVTHPTAPAPIVVESWTWHAEAFRQLLTEQDALRSLLKQAHPHVLSSLGGAMADHAPDALILRIAKISSAITNELEKVS